jgi:hypothetical protein
MMAYRISHGIGQKALRYFYLRGHRLRLGQRVKGLLGLLHIAPAPAMHIFLRRQQPIVAHVQQYQVRLERHRQLRRIR